jgi:L-asparaginase II
MARMASPEACRRPADALRIRESMAAHPFLVGGTKRFGTAVMEAAGGRVLVKGGAEGIYCAMLAEQGLGMALKIDDGAGRAAEVAMGSLLRRFKALDDTVAARLEEKLEPLIRNWVGREVGRIRPADALLT